MSREISILSKELQHVPAIVMRTELNLYQSSIQSASSAFLRRVEQEAKREKTATVTLVAVIKSS